MKYLFISFLVTIIFVFLLTSRLVRIIPGVTAVEFVGGCQIEYHDKTTQPNITLVFACPRFDAIKFWPLPFQQPWEEETFPFPKNHGLIS